MTALVPGLVSVDGAFIPWEGLIDGDPMTFTMNDGTGPFVGIVRDFYDDGTGTVVAAPAAPTLATTGVAGTTTYAYRVTALAGAGETTPSAEVTIATGNAALGGANGNVITFPAKPVGCTGWGVYGRAAGAEVLLARVLSSAASYTDFGGAALGGALPTVNTATSSLFIDVDELGANVPAAHRRIPAASIVSLASANTGG